MFILGLIYIISSSIVALILIFLTVREFIDYLKGDSAWVILKDFLLACLALLPIMIAGVIFFVRFIAN